MILLYDLIHMLFWVGYAISWGFTAVYLQDCGYNSQVIGLVTGIGAVISVLLQPMLAAMMKKNKYMNNVGNIVILKIITVVLAVAMMTKLPGAYTIAIFFTIVAAFDASVPSMLSSIAMECVNTGIAINYGLARGLGSVLYALFSLFIGFAVSSLGSPCLMVMYAAINVVLIFLLFCFRMAQKKQMGEAKRVDEEQKKESLFSLLKEYAFLKYFLAAAVFLFMSHNMVCVFLPMILEHAGGDSSNLGVALFIAAGVEFPVMASFVYLSKKFAIEKLLLFSAVFFGIKSAVAMFAGVVPLVYLVQFIQFGGFALFTPASVYFVNLALKEKDRNIGQALVGACTLGLGGTFGNIIGGMILEQAGLFAMVSVSTCFCIVGFGLMFACLRVYEKSNLKNI